MTIYGYPQVGRHGLGHSMLAWARCAVWCHDNDVEMIAPQWLQPRIGPYLRRERDKRFYAALFQSEGQVSGLKRLYLLASARRVVIADYDARAHSAAGSDLLVCFRNLVAGNDKAYFHEVLGRSELIRDALITMTRPKYRPALLATPHIAVHVRGGDFGMAADPNDLTKGQTNTRLPFGWYVTTLTALRKSLGSELPVIIYSDCSDEEIRELLTLPAVERSPGISAVTDMLAMAQASVLIASGSNFSRWGSYLGQVPRISYPGQRGIRVLDAGTKIELEPEVGAEADLNPAFLEFVRSRMDSGVHSVKIHQGS